jgi:hypothetical protein
MTAIIEFTPLIMPFVRDCSVAAATVAARFAAIEFYKQTLWQQEALEPILLQAGRSIYEIETPPDTVPATVMRADVDGYGAPLTFKTKDELDQLYGSNWTSMDRTGRPTFVTQIEPDQIILVPAPDQAFLDASLNATPPLVPMMRLLVATQPTPDAVEIDDSVFNYYSEPIAYGARARLVETAGQPYYDPQSAPMLWGRFYGGVSEAKARRMRDHTRAVQSVQMRRWV